MTFRMTSIETEARTLLEGYVNQLAQVSSEGGSYQDWFEARLVQMTFSSQYLYSLKVDRITTIARALADLAPHATLDLQPTLTKMVRAKVLRSRQINGVRHYEINFAN